MTPSELKYQVEQAGTSPHFFTRSTMKHWGDTMRNYGTRSATVTLQDGTRAEAWELYRKRPVREGFQRSAWFCKTTFRRLHPKESEV